MKLAAVLVGGFLLMSLLALWTAVRPPRLTIAGRPADHGLTAEDVTLRTADGLRLAAWYVPAPGAPAIVLLHGYPAEKADLLPVAAALHPRFAVLLVDLRYFGASEGGATTLGAREPDDLGRAVDFLAARGHARVGVFGFSLGGAVALLRAADDPRLAAVAVYGTFADLRALGRDLYRWLWLVRYPLVELMILWARLAPGVDLGGVVPEAAAARLTAPVLLVHSRADDVIPFHHAERLQAALAAHPRAELLLLERERHGELPPGFYRRLADFFDRHLGG